MESYTVPSPLSSLCLFTGSWKLVQTVSQRFYHQSIGSCSQGCSPGGSGHPSFSSYRPFPFLSIFLYLTLPPALAAHMPHFFRPTPPGTIPSSASTMLLIFLLLLPRKTASSPLLSSAPSLRVRWRKKTHGLLTILSLSLFFSPLGSIHANIHFCFIFLPSSWLSYMIKFLFFCCYCFCHDVSAHIQAWPPSPTM